MLLPIDAVRDKIVSTIKENQVTIVVGATGSGKTTRLPVFLYEACYSKQGVIGITEPRRIAASSVAKFVAEQLGTNLGDKVGYQIRFDDETSGETKIKFMTDGILLREIQVDPDLKRYSVIMVDEAHERSVNIDFTLGLLKQLLARRSDLKLVVSSATIDSEKFSKYFDNAPVVEVSGRTYPVNIVWSSENYFNRKMVDVIVEKVSTIHTKEAKGDVLVFMTGADDINMVVERLEEKGFNDLVVLPTHGGLAPEDQRRIFMTFQGKRKVIVATNIAETSITVDGVVYVVDSGLVKQTHFDAQTGIQSLDVVRHSQAGCNQRAGRAGRTRPGVCYRMYTEESFTHLPQYTEPEIRRMSLAGVVLAMESIGIRDVEAFQFVDQPDRDAFHEAYETLIALGAIKADRSALTEVGVDMAKLPLEPRIARMVLEADKHGCVEEIATIAAFLSIRNVFIRPKGKEQEADWKHQTFKVETSDALTFLKIWRAYESAKFDRKWCFENYLHVQSLGEVRNVRSQLLNILERGGMKITSTKIDKNVVRSVAAGLIQNLLEHGSRHAYRGVLRQNLYVVYIHPGSAVFGWSNRRWVVCTEVVTTSKSYARGVSEVSPEWLPELAPNHFFFGQSQLVRQSDDGQKMVVARAILHRNQFGGNPTEVGRVETEISMAEAYEIEQKLIRNAESEGLVPLTFSEVETESLYPWNRTKLVGLDRRGNHYGLSILTNNRPASGETHYCSFRPSFIGGGKVDAEPKFQFFNLQKPQVEGETKKAGESVSISMVDQLRSIWNAR